MEQEYPKPLLLIINEPPEYQDLFIDAFGDELNVICMPALKPQLRRQLKELVQQEEICGAVCGLDTSGATAQRSAWFAARQIFRMDIPVVCCTEHEYGEKTWRILKGRFPELKAEIPYFALAEEDDISVVLQINFF
ncbi:TPA: hypothetical protein EYP66_02210 [Candidatus Poribacteria bacterium]|nr:hypothetical protein [Candidatus Poribacteria bacterium]